MDVERGYWGKNDQEVETDFDDPMTARKEKVIPYVEDRRNSLLLAFHDHYDAKIMASLQAALKNAIQVRYQLEDNELAVEPLPTRDNRRLILLYEAAEGGAEVLRQLVTDHAAMPTIARTALDLCHFDPDTRKDRRRALHAREDYEAACYNCLMSYFNQPDHQMLDRKLIVTPLYELASGQVHLSPSRLERTKHLATLKAQCESSLESAWLDFLQAHNLRLPDVAQKLIPQCNTRCDFYYTDKAVAIYVDGPPHEQADVAVKDRDITNCLTHDLGVTVLRFHHGQQAHWAQIVADHAYVFGKVHA